MPRMPRIAVVDQGTNSTRLLAADVDDGAVTELERRTIVTRFGEGVDATGRLSDAAIGRVEEALRGLPRDHRPARGGRGRGRRHQRDARRRERAGVPRADAGTVRHRPRDDLRRRGGPPDLPRRNRRARRHRGDGGGGHRRREHRVRGRATRPRIPPSACRRAWGRCGTPSGSSSRTRRARREVRALSDDVARTVEAEVPEDLRTRTEHGIAVAGTATTLAAIDQELDPYDPDRVHGYRLGVDACERILAKLAALPLEERRQGHRPPSGPGPDDRCRRGDPARVDAGVRARGDRDQRARHPARRRARRGRRELPATTRSDPELAFAPNCFIVLKCRAEQSCA